MRLMNSIRISLLVGIFLALLGVLVCPCSAQTNKSFVEFSQPSRMTVDFRNRFTLQSEKQAEAKLKRFQESTNEVTVADFLGDKITGFRITYYDFCFANAAIVGVQDALGSVICSPSQVSGQSPTLEHREEYSVSPIVTVQAVLKYRNGREGFLQCSGSGILIAQDCDGTYWWNIRCVPREILPDSSSPVRPVNLKLPIRIETNRSSSAAGSRR
ncbi:MAG: hypothetical protein FJ395_20685 [Verrucomicrobia bacterium]|nr:hypothetical protein [Verrucomicrobiota bacterium]